jgi:TRAP-type mannitol/chloroaromatic compound transport system permease large subunit
MAFAGVFVGALAGDTTTVFAEFIIEMGITGLVTR